jgi:phosphatidylserine decarboxylase
MRLLPKKGLSRGVRQLARVRSRAAVRRYAEHYQVMVEEAEKPLDEYPTLLDFFTRRLKPGLRPLDPDPASLLCPVDGRLYHAARIEQGQLIQAKGRTFSLAALLASEERAAHFEGGAFLTLYLSPRDYHRVHAPAAGRVLGYSYIPGDLFPVNPRAVAEVDRLFARNERLITHLETERFGRIEVVMVGATSVGHMKVCYDPAVATNVGGRDVTRREYRPPLMIERGAELGVFEMGSTVILIVEPRVQIEAIAPDAPVRVGQKLGRSG